MQKHCLKTGEKKPAEPQTLRAFSERREAIEQAQEHIGLPVERSLEGVIAMYREAEEKLAQMKSCPGSCEDGSVEISLSAGQVKKFPCPLISAKCEYGKLMNLGLNHYIASVMSAIGVPARHLGKLPEPLKTEAVIGAAKWNFNGFLVFFGCSGSGKSFGAALAVYEYLKSIVPNPFDQRTWKIAERTGNSIVWGTAMDITGDGETAERMKREFLAVIDDLGGEAESQERQAVLRGIIQRRHDMKLPTVITTALTMLDVDIRYGGRVADRLTEDVGDGGRIIGCGDVSLRTPAVFFAAGRGQNS